MARDPHTTPHVGRESFAKEGYRRCKSTRKYSSEANGAGLRSTRYWIEADMVDAALNVAAEMPVEFSAPAELLCSGRATEARSVPLKAFTHVLGEMNGSPWR